MPSMESRRENTTTVRFARVQLRWELRQEIELRREELHIEDPRQELPDVVRVIRTRESKDHIPIACRSNPMLVPLMKNTRMIEPRVAPIVRSTAISRLLFFTSMIRPEMMFITATITMSMTTMYDTFRCTAKRLVEAFVALTPIAQKHGVACRGLQAWPEVPDIFRVGNENFQNVHGPDGILYGKSVPQVEEGSALA